MKTMYLKVLVIVGLVVCIQGQVSKLQKENYLRDYRKSWSDAYMPSDNILLVGSACSKAVKKFNEAISSTNPEDFWPLTMVDSWGKFKDGLYYGDPHILGAYDQCLRTASPDNSIRGKYCSIVKVPPQDSERDGHSMAKKMGDGLSIDHPFQWRGQNINKLIKGISDDFMNPRNTLSKEMKNPKVKNSINLKINGSTRIGQLPVEEGYRTYGTCIPNDCSQENLQNSLLANGDRIWFVKCDDPDMDISLDALDGSFIAFFSIIATLMLAGTAAHTYMLLTKKEHLAKGPFGFLLPFDISTNLKKLFTVNPRPAPGTISCLNGMRVMSMCWVIWGHQNLFTLAANANGNNLYMLGTFLIQILLNADLSVDTFFFMSGLLVCYAVMREMKKTGRISIPMYYIHRILRLTPPIAVTVWFCSTVHRFALRGPIPFSYSPSPMGLASYCRKMGWRDILYVSTVDFFSNQKNIGGCLGQCWYTSVDTQLYALAPLVLLPLYYFKTAGRVWMYVVTLASIAMRGFVTWNEVNRKQGGNYWLYDNYNSTWCRGDVWLIGAWTGYFIVNMGKKKLQLKPWQTVAGWTLAVVFGLLTMFARYNAPYDSHGAGHIMYEMIHRTVWCSCLGWVTIACHYGYGGIVNDFLSHPSWQPFSRLTFGMYLIGMQFTYDLTFAKRTLFYFTNMNKIIETCGILFFSCIYAVLLSISIEAPILGLEKMLLKRPGRGVDKKPSAGPGHIDKVTAPTTGPAIEVVGKTLPPGYVKHAETVGASGKQFPTTGHDNIGFVHHEDEGIPLKDLPKKHSEAVSEQLEQHQQAPSYSIQSQINSEAVPSKNQDSNLGPLGFSAPEGGADSAQPQQVFIGTQVTVEVHQHNVDPSS